mgnify:CR=1 FL=1
MLKGQDQRAAADERCAWPRFLSQHRFAGARVGNAELVLLTPGRNFCVRLRIDVGVDAQQHLDLLAHALRRRRAAALVAPTDGFLRQAYVRPGDPVKAEQLVAEGVKELLLISALGFSRVFYAWHLPMMEVYL